MTLPGFYDDVRPLTDAEQASFARLPFRDADWMAEAGVRRLEGEAGRSTLERVWSRPTCDVVGIGVGYTGDGIKTIVPARGGFKVTFRLVPDQHPAQVADAFRAWLAAMVPDGIDATVTPEGAVAPALTPVDHPAVGALDAGHRARVGHAAAVHPRGRQRARGGARAACSTRRSCSSASACPATASTRPTSAW